MPRLRYNALIQDYPSRESAQKTKLFIMKKKIQILVFVLLVVLVSIPASANPILQTLSGLVLAVDLNTSQLRVQFEHPVTGENELKIFNVDHTTGFKHVKGLNQIKPQDPVSVDYEEKTPNDLKAVYIEVVRLNDVPFTKEQIQKALF